MTDTDTQALDEALQAIKEAADSRKPVHHAYYEGWFQRIRDLFKQQQRISDNYRVVAQRHLGKGCVPFDEVREMLATAYINGFDWGKRSSVFTRKAKQSIRFADEVLKEHGYSNE